MVEYFDSLKKRFSNPVVIAALVSSLIFYSGIFPEKEKNSFMPDKQKIISIQGCLESNPSVTSTRKYYITKLETQKYTVKSANSQWTSSCKGKIDLLVPSNIVEALYPGRMFSLSDGLLSFEKGENVRLWGNFSDKFFIVSKAESLGFNKGIKGRIEKIRAFCRIKFKKLMYSWGKGGALVLSLLSGSREYTEKKVSDAFRKSGLSHVLALSGMHLSFMSALSDKTGSKIFGKKYSFWVKLSGILFFVWFAGLSPSLTRALICSIIMLLYSVLRCNTPDYFKILSFSFLLHGIFIPSDLKTTAFMLSYLALAGILISGDLFTAFFKLFINEKISSAMGASVSAQAATLPLSITMFGTVYPAGIIASVLVSPIVSIFLTVAFTGIVSSLIIPASSNLWGKTVNVIYFFLMTIVQFFSGKS